MDDLPSNRLRLLIVENDRVTARDLEATLRRRGFLIAGIAYSAGQALDFLKGERPDLAILDIQLEEAEDGIELARRLRREYGIPSVFVTGYSEEQVLHRAQSAQPAAVLRKPFSDAEIAVCLESVVERRIAGERLSLRLPGLEAVSQHLPQAVFATDLDGNLAYLNAAASTLVGWSVAEALHQPFASVAPLSEGDPATESGQTSSPSESGPETTSRRFAQLATRDGRKLQVEERSVPIRTSDGEAIGLVTVLAVEGLPGDLPSIPSPISPPPRESGAVEPSEPVQPVVFPPSQPPAARSEALRKIASIASDPAFRSLIARKPQPAKPSASIDPQTTAPTRVPADSWSPPPVGAGVADAQAVFASAGAAGQSVLPPGGATPFEEVGDPLMRLDEDGIIRYANAEADRVFAAGKRLVGSPFNEHFDGNDLERYEDHFHRPLADGRRHRFDFHDSSRGMWFEVRAYPTRGGVLLLFTDITATRLEAAEEIRQHRLEGLGLLARGFAHDFNNSLTTLTGNVSLARERHPEDDELQSMLAEALSAAAKATGLVQQLMTFARGGRPIRERTRIPDLIRRLLTEHRLRHPEIRYQYQGADPEIIANVDPAQIGRLVENLLANSAAAMPDGGVLIVRSSRVSPESVLRIRGSHTPSEEDHLLIEVIDTGHGMSERDLERVFEPYFTTRRENNATGIGLTVCESIAKAHGGFIQLQSKEGKGTIATFCAPLGRRTEELGLDDGVPAYPNFDIPNLALSRSAENEEPLLVGTRILILEDDAPIRRLMAATLRRAGHEVVETKDGRETIAVYTEAIERGERFHLLICDLTIENGMGGVETMRRLLEIDPGVLSIVSSGYSDAPAMSSPAAFGFKGVLPKPYAPTELRAAVHRILTAHHIIP
ncbi:MAG: response regulator [Verrucomicrobiae bacterium]|nr:response regulator [Verrucomicrobiae bacterium]